MQFQILDADKRPISMGILDKEAAEFFGVEVQDKTYASPDNIKFFDWFNLVGSSIANLPRGTYEWSDIIGNLCRVQAIGIHNVEELIEDIRKISPHIEFCIHWRAKGYTPMSL